MVRQVKENTVVEQDKEVTKVRSLEKRRPFGVPVSRLGVNKEIEGYHLRWVNDTPGRLAMAQQSGYEFVAPEEVGRIPFDRDDQRVKELADTTSKDGLPTYAYLMKIPQEWFEQDKDIREEQQDQFDDAIRAGTIESRAGDGRYVPKNGISYKTNLK
jgi:hypothetical protein